MRVSAVAWDRSNLAHFREHGRCRRVEVEAVLTARPHPTRAVALPARRGDAPRWLFHGCTAEGRHLAVATMFGGGVARPITCWPMADRAVERYEAWKRTVKR